MQRVFGDINSLRESAICPEGHDIPSERYACGHGEFISYRAGAQRTHIVYAKQIYRVLRSKIYRKKRNAYAY